MLAVVWTWWIALILVPATIGLLVMIVAGYLFSVTRQQYPSRKQRKLQ